MAIVLNPQSGSAPQPPELVRGLAKVSVVADVHTMPGERQDTAGWIDALAQRYDTLVAAGGDGTVSTVAAAVVKTGKTLGVIPAGTLNHFAWDAGIPLQLEPALRALAARHTELLDVGIVNDRVFVNNASIGAYPRMVWERNRARQRGLPKPIAYALAIIDTWLELSWINVRLLADNQELVRRSPFVVVGNNEYEVEGLHLGKRPTMTDGRLSLYVAPDSGRLDLLALTARALLRRLKRYEKFEAWTASSIAIDVLQREIDVALDGEISSLAPPLRFGVKPRALKVIVPVKKEG